MHLPAESINNSYLIIHNQLFITGRAEEGPPPPSPPHPPEGGGGGGACGSERLSEAEPRKLTVYRYVYGMTRDLYIISGMTSPSHCEE